MLKKRKLKWFGHVSRSARLPTTILQGTEQGGGRRDQQKKRWENNMSEWTGLKFCNVLREAENKLKWRERVARSMVPQWSPRLRDRCKVQISCFKTSLSCKSFNSHSKDVEKGWNWFYSNTYSVIVGLPNSLWVCDILLPNSFLRFSICSTKLRFFCKREWKKNKGTVMKSYIYKAILFILEASSSSLAY